MLPNAWIAPPNTLPALPLKFIWPTFPVEKIEPVNDSPRVIESNPPAMVATREEYEPSPAMVSLPIDKATMPLRSAWVVPERRTKRCASVSKAKNVPEATS